MTQTLHNLALKTIDEQRTLQVDMAASSVAYEEKYGQLVNINEIKKNIPTDLLEYFDIKLEHYRNLSKKLGKLDSIED
ncbi:DNA polymerase III subunit theta [Thorsellia kenyensis]|uniref:DNA polymerase III subunit theta n=1 Tax=Thorsellia kenyensis TaxID=1549888 RepID=A0ABV6CH31_9GAMM